MEGTLELRGRDQERARLGEALRRTKDGHGSCVLITGEPGLGKTALLDMLVEEAEAAGFTTMRAKTDELEQSRPFGVIRRCIADRSEGDQLEYLLTQPRDQGATQGWIEQPELRFRVIDSIVDTVDRLASEAPVALVIDDYQWVDRSSADAVKAVLDRLSDRSVLVVLAARPSLHPDHPSPSDLPESDQLQLRPLTAVDVAALVRDLVGSQPEEALLRDAARAGGNPFFIEALVTSAIAHSQDGRLRDPADVYFQEAPLRAALAQFYRLSEDTQEIIRIASVIGSTFSPTLIADLSGHSITNLTRSLDEALRAHVLVDDGRQLAFAHDILRESIYASISQPVSAGLHVAIGHRLLARGLPAPAVAAHFMRGAELGDSAASDVLRAAAAELGRVAPAMATELLERAVELIPTHHPDRSSCLVELIQSYVFSGDLERSSELADEHVAGTLPEEVELGLRNARSQVFFLRGEAQRASSEFESMVPLVKGQSREALLMADAAISAMFAIDLERARNLAHRSVDAAADRDDSAAPALANGVLSWLTAFTGNLEGGLDLAESAVAAADMAPGLEGHRRIPHLFHAQVALWSDHVDVARRSLARGQKFSSELGMGWDEPMYHALLADERLRCAEWDDALAVAEAGLARAEEVGSHFADGWLFAHQARIHLWRGDLNTARDLLDQAQAEQGSAMQSADQHWHLRALLAMNDGDDATATTIMTALWGSLQELGVHLRQLEISSDVMRHAVRTNDDRLAEEVQATVDVSTAAFDTPLAHSAQIWCRALRTDCPDTARQAVAAVRDRQVPVDLARCQADAATIMHRSGHLAASAELVELATRLFRDLGADGLNRHHLGELAPRLDHPSEPPVVGWESLTLSEKKIVGLVSEGLSNSQIAEDLSISRRTVESHLYHAYPKLGLSNRVELAVFAARQL